MAPSARHPEHQAGVGRHRHRRVAGQRRHITDQAELDKSQTGAGIESPGRSSASRGCRRAASPSRSPRARRWRQSSACCRSPRTAWGWTRSSRADLDIVGRPLGLDRPIDGERRGRHPEHGALAVVQAPRRAAISTRSPTLKTPRPPAPIVIVDPANVAVPTTCLLRPDVARVLAAGCACPTAGRSRSS